MTADFGNALERHLPRMYRVALRIVGDADKAEEAVQNACVNVVRSREAFKEKAALSTWLHRIVVNCALDHLRSEQRTSRRRVDSDGDPHGMVRWLGLTPDAQAEQHESYRTALAALEALPDDCRSAFVLTQVDGYTYDEAAEILRQPRGTVASRVHRAKNILLDRLAIIRLEGEQE